MNWQQLSAVILLRWQMSRNQWRKAGTLNAVLMSLLAMLVLLTSVLAFFGALVGGYFLLPRAQPDHLLILWDILAIGFLVCWLFGLMMELQRSELLSLDKLLHLPVSLFGAFLLNYLSSLASFSLAVFVPLAIGLNLALVATHGPAMLLVGPLIVGFLMMITGVTYQFRGWLARLMENKRRRGTVLAAITISFILLSQLPNVINVVVMRSSHLASRAADAERNRQSDALRAQVGLGQITPEEFNRMTELQAARQTDREQRLRAAVDRGKDWLRLANKILPIGWLPFGTYALAEGRCLPALLGTAGMFAIGLASLRRSFRGTMNSYTRVGGEQVRDQGLTAATAKRTRELLISRKLPFVPDSVSVVALASLTSAIRSPEGKMMLISPLFFLGLVGMLLIAGPKENLPPEAFAPIGIVSIGMTLLSVVQFLFNAFGTDRAGFRAYMLMPVERRDILLGKNLSLAPLMLGLNGLLVAVLACALPLRISHVPATLIQAGIAFLLTCLVGNALSIFVPVTLPAGSFRPQNIRAVPMLLHFLGMLLMPLSVLPAAVSWGIEFGVESLTNVRWIPWYLLLSLGEAMLCVAVYLSVVAEQGRWLHRRETRILETVASSAE